MEWWEILLTIIIVLAILLVMLLVKVIVFNIGGAPANSIFMKFAGLIFIILLYLVMAQFLFKIEVFKSL